MIELILVRHGETASNKRSTYCGWTDRSLNETGIKQAYSARDKLSGVKINKIYSSPLKRAAKTAEIINESFGQKIIYSDALRERNFGVWDDMSYKDICVKFPKEVKLWENDWINYCIQDGESALEAHERVTAFIDSLISENKKGTFIVVTHLGCVRSIIAHLLGMGIQGVWRFRVDTGSITRLIINNEKYAYLTALNI